MSKGKTPAQRPAFNPDRVPDRGREGSLFASRGGKDNESPSSVSPLTVSQLTRLVKGAIQKGLPAEVRVTGELSNFSRPSGGHCYFTLKDGASEVRCVMWRSSGKTLRFDPQDGLSVVAVGSVDVYEPRGQYQLYVRRMEPQGLGSLEVAFRRLKEKLEAEGLFDAARKRPLPSMPRRIAVVTSPTGAAIRDITQTIQRRFPCVEVLILGVRVQGEGAAEEVADAIRRINLNAKKLGGIDVMIVGRGGGSLEDLWAFNEEGVARAIYASKIPVVSAVGHEVDFTIADFVADERAATPTAAAELAVPVLDSLLDGLDGTADRLLRAVSRAMEMAAMRLAAVERCEWFRDPLERIRHREQQLDEVANRLRLAMWQLLKSGRTSLHENEVRLVRVRPEALLARRREILAKMEHRLRWARGHSNLLAERRLREAMGRMVGGSPIHRIMRCRDLLSQYEGRLQHGVRHAVEERCRAVESLETRLSASSHEQVLGRGFSITRAARGGRLVRKTSDVREGEKLYTETGEGKIASRVVDDRQGELFE